MKKNFRLVDHLQDPAFPFSIGPRFRLPGDSFQVHTHDFSELAVVVAGSAVHRINRETHVTTVGDVYVFNGSTAHGFTEARNFELINVMYDPARFLPRGADVAALPGYHALFVLEPIRRERGRFKGRLHLAAAQLREVSRLLDAMQAEYDSHRPGFQSAITGLFTELVVFLSRAYSTRRPVKEPLWRLAETLSYIEMNFREPITLEALARKAYLSANQFLRVFRQATGTTPVDYITRLRIQEACGLLTDSSRSITDIAFDVGFTDSNYFSRQFRKTMGESPRAYRKRSQV